MSSQVSLQTQTVVVSTAPDRARDSRVERFWESVCKLIFDERRTLDWKRSALARYSKVLARTGDGMLADLAGRLAESYGESQIGTAAWS